MTHHLTDGLTHVHSGKVRELYRTEEGLLLLVATDRISAFDHILEPPVPDKGRALTTLSAWWFERLSDIAPTHMISISDPRIPSPVLGRAMLCRDLDMIPVEAVARGYLTGSALTQYQASRTVGDVRLPSGLRDGDRLPHPIFTPARKAPKGAHDENISRDTLSQLIGHGAAAAIEQLTLRIYEFAADVAAKRGLILADTKLEFGRDRNTGELVLADEALTPDSSRFWPAENWNPGSATIGLDKQYVRDWLLSPQAGWQRDAGTPPPPLPPQVVSATRARYLEAVERIAGLPMQTHPARRHGRTSVAGR